MSLVMVSLSSLVLVLLTREAITARRDEDLQLRADLDGSSDTVGTDDLAHTLSAVDVRPLQDHVADEGLAEHSGEVKKDLVTDEGLADQKSEVKKDNVPQQQAPVPSLKVDPTLQPEPSRTGGSIRWAKSGKCLDVIGGSTRNGAHIGLFDCFNVDVDAHVNQEFILPPDGKGPVRWLTHPNKCLDVAGGEDFNGNNIGLFSCLRNGTHPNQQFILPASGVGPIRWAAHPNKCLDVMGGGDFNGNKIGLYECLQDGTHPNMQFVLPQLQKKEAFTTSTKSNVTSDTIVGTREQNAIIAVHKHQPEEPPQSQEQQVQERVEPIRWATHPNKCFDVAGGVNKNGNPIVLFDCLNAGTHANQLFIFPKGLSGPLRWSAHPEKCLDVSGGIVTNGNSIVIFDCLQGGKHPNQQFTLSGTGGAIRWSANPDKCIDVVGGRTSNGNSIGIYDCLNNGSHANMQFIFGARNPEASHPAVEGTKADMQNSVGEHDLEASRPALEGMKVPQNTSETNKHIHISPTDLDEQAHEIEEQLKEEALYWGAFGGLCVQVGLCLAALALYAAWLLAGNNSNKKAS